ncbi:alpha/beta fold hydrolase [Desulfurococcaceae archaeon MEX13E-LK6-19]|nr:alpha/beta fold hydrolase [Desulfurococcaceae archaeon MEX13E-LK6-19]
MIDQTILIYLVVSLTALVILIALLLVGLAKAAANKLVRPPRKVLDWKPSDLGFNYEDAEVTTDDGVKLKGWIIPRGSDKTVIVLHGYTSSKWDEDYIKPVIEILARNNFNVVAFDFRAHGASEGEITTLGYREVDDVRKIIDWLQENKPELAKSIGVIGYSMGGAVSLMLASKDSRVKAVVADSPYINIITSGRRWIKRLKPPLRNLLLSVYSLIVKYTSKKANINVKDLVILNYADKIKQPVFIIAGRKDDLVALHEIEEFYKKLREHNENVELWVVDTGHVAAIKDYPKEYEEKVVGFFKRWL